MFEALTLAPDQPQVRLTLAAIYNGTGQLDLARTELQSIADLQPRNDEVHRRIGRILALQGDRSGAVEAYRQAIVLRPGYWRTHYDLGRDYYRFGQLPEAIDAYETAIRLQPDNAAAYHNVGTIYHTLDDTTQALEYYNRAIALDGERAPTLANIGRIHYDEGRLEDATRAYERAAEIAPTAFRWGNLANVYGELNRRADADNAFIRAIELTRDLLEVNAANEGALSRLAVYEAHLERWQEADSHSLEAVELAPTNGEVLFNRCIVLALSDRPDEALLALEQALDNGYPPAEAAKEDDLESLRALPGFVSLLEGLE